MIKNKNALEKQEQKKVNSNNSLAQWELLCKQAYDEICAVCENGSLKDLIMLRAEIVSEKTNNKWNLIKIDKAIKERFV